MTSILECDRKIKSDLKSSEQNLSHVKEEYAKLLSSPVPTTYVGVTERKEKLKELKKTIDSAECKTLYKTYVASSENIVKEFIKSMKRPTKVSLLTGKRTEDDDVKNLTKKFFVVVKNFFPAMDIKREDSPAKGICSCGNETDFTDDRFGLVCNVCGDKIIKQITDIITDNLEINREINSRIHLSTKYKYDPKIHFRDAIRQKQGIQNKKIPPEIYTCLEGKIMAHREIYNAEGKTFAEKYKNVTSEQIKDFLTETKNTEYIEDANYFYKYYTGKKCQDLSSIEDSLLADFDVAVGIYDTLSDDIKEGRKNFLESDFILYQFLKRMGIKVDKNDYEFPRTRDILLKHEKIYEEICRIAQWNYEKIS
jgi:hypothetical protein